MFQTHSYTWSVSIEFSACRKGHAMWVILVDARMCLPEYRKYNITSSLHRREFGNDLIARLRNETFVPCILENFMRGISFYHNTCPDYIFRWTKTLLMFLADRKIQYWIRVKVTMMIICSRCMIRSGG